VLFTLLGKRGVIVMVSGEGENIVRKGEGATMHGRRRRGEGEKM